MRHTMIIVALATPAWASDRDGTDADAVREAIARSWESIRTLHFRSEETCRDADGQITHHISTNYHLDDGDRRVVEVHTYPFGGGKDSHLTYIEDGEVFTLASSRTKTRDGIYQLLLRDQTSTRGNLTTGAGCAALMLWTPVGRPLTEHLEAGG